MIPDRKPNVYAATAYNSERLPNIHYQPGLGDDNQMMAKHLPFGHTDIGTVPHYIYEVENPSEIRKEEEKTDEERKAEIEKSRIKIDMKWDHRCIRYDSISGWSQALVMLNMVSKYTAPAIFIFLFIVTITMEYFRVGELRFKDAFDVGAIISAIPFALFILTWIIMRLPSHWWIRNSKGAQWELNRETGMVKIFNYRTDEYKKTKSPTIFERPFYEFEALIFQVPNRHGGLEESLLLCHRSEGHAINFNCFSDDLREQEWIRFWHFIQNYMDVSKPLPDTPHFESSRQYDPTTVEYDKRTGRDPRYWRDMSDEDYKHKTHLAHYQTFIDPDKYPCIIKARAKQGSLANA